MGNFLFGCNSILVYFVLLFVEGKAAKLLSNSHFNKVASKHYDSLSEADKVKLIENVASDVELTKQDVVKKIRKIFCQIQDKVKRRNNDIQLLQAHVFIFIIASTCIYIYYCKHMYLYLLLQAHVFIFIIASTCSTCIYIHYCKHMYLYSLLQAHVFIFIIVSTCIYIHYCKHMYLYLLL